MSSELKLVCAKREGKAPEGQVPGVVYGSDIDPTSLSFDALTLSKMYQAAGSNHIIDLDIEGDGHEVLFKEVSINSVTRRIDHVDLYAIKRGQKVTANIPVVLMGKSPAEERGLILSTLIDEVEVTTEPKNLPDQLELSKEALVEADDILRISDITNLADNVELALDPNTVVAKVEEPRAAAEEVEEEDAEGDEAAAGTEGEAAAEGDAAKAEGN